MKEITYKKAINEALREEMEKEETVILMGQDIGQYGGFLGQTQGLLQKFGPMRVIDTPISEGGTVGVALGCCLRGFRPVVEITFMEFIPCCMDEIVNWAAPMYYSTAGKVKMPIVIRTTFGSGPHRMHPECFEAWFAHVPGLKVVTPSTPADAKGLLKSAIRDDNPVLFLEHKYHLCIETRGMVPCDDQVVPIGKAKVVREGTDITIVTYGLMVQHSLDAANLLSEKGIEAEVIDLRTLSPLDDSAIISSIQKTRRLATVQESWIPFGVGAEIITRVIETDPALLKNPAIRIGPPFIHISTNPKLQDLSIPNSETIMLQIINGLSG